MNLYDLEDLARDNKIVKDKKYPGLFLVQLDKVTTELN